MCTVYGTHKYGFGQIFSLKLGLTTLFTHLKMILLQYFQFSAISSIRIDHYFILIMLDLCHWVGTRNFLRPVWFLMIYFAT